jgi:hypothetical protein
MQTIHGEPSFHLGTPELDLHVTARGGHMAPVVFHLPDRNASPYALAPWEPAEFPDQPPLLSVLRGDFFCLPFGGQSNGPPHGDPANAEWTMLEHDTHSLKLVMETSDSGAKVAKTIATRPGHHAIYFEHEISNLHGNFNFGTHPILDFSNLPQGAGRVTSSPFHWASVYPGVFSNPAAGETQKLLGNSEFLDLREVQLASGGTADLTYYPDTVGHDDLVMMSHPPATPDQPFAWTAAVLDGYLWFALKNPADFPSTLLWISNGGRSAPPWNDRHLARLGIEDVCSYFCDGVDQSRLDLLAERGIPTTRHFHSDQPATLRKIHAVASVPPGFGAVEKILPAGLGVVKIIGDSGLEISATVDWNFLVETPIHL